MHVKLTRYYRLIKYYRSFLDGIPNQSLAVYLIFNLCVKLS